MVQLARHGCQGPAQREATSACMQGSSIRLQAKQIQHGRRHAVSGMPSPWHAITMQGGPLGRPR